MSSTSALLATITEMQTRLLEVQQQLAAQLRREAVAPPAPVVVTAATPSVVPRGRIPYSYPGSHATMNTAIRLQSPESLYSPSVGLSRGGSRGGGHRASRGRGGHGGRGGAPREDAVRSGAVRGRGGRGGRGGAVHTTREQGQDESKDHRNDHRNDHRKETVELDALLALNESVFFHVIVKKDSEGKPVYTTCRSTFDGSVLTVVESEAAPSLIGHQANKPGVILYQFMDALKASGQLKRSFTIAPWKLCYVVREGQRHTLESLLFEALGKAKVATVEPVATVASEESSLEPVVAAVAEAEAVVVVEEAKTEAEVVVVPSTPQRKTKPKMKKAISNAVSEATVSEAVSEVVVEAAAPEVEAVV